MAVEHITQYEQGLYAFLYNDPGGRAVMGSIKHTGNLDEETESRLKCALEEYTERFLQNHRSIRG